jgi:hypothetical protein
LFHDLKVVATVFEELPRALARGGRTKNNIGVLTPILDVMPDVFALHQIDYVLGYVGGVVPDLLQMT